MRNLTKLAATLIIALHFAAAAQSLPVAPANPTPWHVALEASIGHEPLTFTSRGARLSGTLHYPAGAQPGPAVIVLHGASSPTQDLPLYEHLKKILPPLGIAVFTYDRRGSGASTGGDDQYDLQVLAADAVAARTALSSNPHVDAARIGYWGISQGGWLALSAASIDPKAAFAISVSAPTTTPDVQMNFAVENILRIHGYGQEDVSIALRARRAVDDYLRGKLDRATAEQALNAARQRPWFSLIYLDDTVGDPKTSTWLKQMQFDPMTLLDKVSAPVLMLYGQDDPWVPAGLSIDRLRAITRQHPSIAAAIVPAGDHTMMLGVDPKEQVDPNFFPKEAPDAPAYFSFLSAWLAQQGFAHIRGTL